jgi:hypothetical protein
VIEEVGLGVLTRVLDRSGDGVSGTSTPAMDRVAMSRGFVNSPLDMAAEAMPFGSVDVMAACLLWERLVSGSRSG